MSCNIYFALAGLATGGDALASWAERVGFGAPIPFDLPTAASQVTNGGGSFGGGFADDVELANAAYGQGETLVTPLQMALVAAAVANGGDADAAAPRDRAVAAATATPRSSPQVWRQVVSAGRRRRRSAAAMVRAVEGDAGGCSRPAPRSRASSTAGKSGTAQLDGSAKPHSWFIGFAPADAPAGRDRGPRRVGRERRRPGRRRSPAS